MSYLACRILSYANMPDYIIWTYAVSNMMGAEEK